MKELEDAIREKICVETARVVGEDVFWPDKREYGWQGKDIRIVTVRRAGLTDEIKITMPEPVPCSRLSEEFFQHKASPSSILTGKTAYVNGSKVTGTCTFACPPFTVHHIETIMNEKAVTIVHFVDGTKTKAVCPEEEYDAYTGLAICLMKKMLGEKEFHKLMRDSMKRNDRYYANKAAEQKLELEEKRREARRKDRIERRQARRRLERIQEQALAYAIAMQKVKDIDTSENEDA